MSLGNTNIHQQGEIPEITKLPNGRIRVVRRFVKFTREDVDNVQLGTLLGEFGDLDTTDEQIPNQGYTNCRLIEVEVEKSTSRNAGTDSISSVLVQTYETLTSEFVEITNPTISYSENGLKKVTKVSRAISGTTNSNVVGTTFIPVDPEADPLVPDVWLASYEIEDNTAFAELTEVYIEAGILSETIDKVGSQQSTVIESIKIEPTAPAGYVLASQQKSEFEGLQTNRFTFLKPDVELSNSEDNVGSENRITEQWFKPSLIDGTNPLTVDRRVKTGYSLARKQVSDVEGIPTEEYTFLKNNVVLSVSQDRVGSQLAVTNEVFNPSADSITGVDIDNVALVGYSEANRQKSDFEGIPTIKYSFLKNDVQLSKSEDNVGSQLAEIEEWFNPSLVAGGDPVTVNRKIKAGYSLAKEEKSDVGGIPTARYTFLKNNVQLSESEDKVGSQNAITEEWFKPVTGTATPANNRNVKTNYSLAKEEASDVEGIPTERYTFLKNDVNLSTSSDKVGSQLAIVEEWFKPVTGTGTPANNRNVKANYSLAKEEVSDVEGIPTARYTFLKDNVKLSESSDKVGSQLTVIEEWFKPLIARKTKTGYSLGKEEASDVAGIPTERYTFLKNNVKLSESEDKVGSQNATVEEWFNPIISDPIAIPPVVGRDQKTGYSLARSEVSDVQGIPTARYTFLENNVQLSESKDRVGSQLAITEEWFNPTAQPIILGYVLGDSRESDFDGIPTKKYTFLKEDVNLSTSSDKVGSQLAITEEWFKPSLVVGTNPVTVNRKIKVGYELAKDDISDTSGIPTARYTFLKSNVKLSDSIDKVGSQNAINEQWFKPVTDSVIPADNRNVKAGYSLAREEVSDVQGIPTARYTFLKDDVQLSESSDKVGSQLATTEEWFKPVTGSATPANNRNVKAGYSLAKEEVSDVDGIPTVRYTFLRENILLTESLDNVGSQLATVEEWFKPVTGTGTPANNRNVKSGYSLAKEEASDVDGIPTVRYTFLKDDVQLSSSEDIEGSQNTTIEEWFKPVVSSVGPPEVIGRDQKTGYSLAKEAASNVQGIPTVKYTFLKAGILNISQEFNSGLGTVVVETFLLSKSQVIALLPTQLANKEVISESKDNYLSLETNKFEFQFEESFVEDYELNGLKRIEIIELSSSNFTAGVVGQPAVVWSAGDPEPEPDNPVSATSPVVGLYLATQEIDNGGSIKTKSSVWIESGVLQKEERNVSDGLIEHTVKSLGTATATVGPVVDQSIENFEGLQVITNVDLRNATGGAPTSGTTPVLLNTYEDNVSFTYPGVVSVQHDQVFFGTGANDFQNILSFIMRPPVQASTKATIYTFLQTSPTIAAADYIYGSSFGYWNPLAWAEAYQSGYSWGGTPFSETQGLRGYRLNPDISGVQTFNNTGTSYQLLSNGVTISTLSVDSLDAFVVEQFEYTNNGGSFDPVETLWTGQTSGAKGISKLYGSKNEGVFGFKRSGTGTNTIPFLEGENVKSGQSGGNRKRLGRNIGNATFVVGNSDQNGYRFSLNSKRIYARTPFQMKLSGGPEDPSGKKWVLQVKIEPSFQDVDGTKYYKKTIVTSDII